MLYNIYEEIDHIIKKSKEDEDSETPQLDYNDVEHILSASGVENVDTERVKQTFQTIFDDEQHAFEAESLLPNKVKINRSEEHTSELQSRGHLVCRLLL